MSRAGHPSGTTLGLALLATLLFARPAAADVTVFGGATLSPDTRPTIGLALGLTLRPVALEFEYAYTTADAERQVPSLSTGTFGVLVHTPRVARLRGYGTVGGGLYREAADDRHDTGLAAVFGAGVMIELVAGFRLRLDYRRFSLTEGARRPAPQRAYAAFSLVF